MLNLISGVLTVVGLCALSGLCGGIGFAYVVSKLIDKKIKEYESL